MRRWAISVVSPVRVWASLPRARCSSTMAAQVGVAVEGGSAETGAGGDLVEGDGLSGEDQCGAGVFDALRGVCSGVSSGLCLTGCGRRGVR